MDDSQRATTWALWACRITATPASPKHAAEDATAAQDAYHAEVSALPANTRIVHRDDPDYPSALLDLRAPPTFLYIRGILYEQPSLAMIGTRDPDPEGVRIAARLAAAAATSGLTVISGGARGIDATCHQACLDHDGPTIAVLPSSVDAPSPAQNRALFEHIVQKGGALISEYPLATPTRKHFFARRNALIAALGQRLLVIRARQTGGSMLTVTAARELGRPIYVVPGSPEDPTSAGCNELLRQQATPVWLPEHLGLQPRPKMTGPNSNAHLQLLRALDQLGVATEDELSDITGITSAQVAMLSLELQLANFVFREGPSLRRTP